MKSQIESIPVHAAAGLAIAGDSAPIFAALGRGKPRRDIESAIFPPKEGKRAREGAKNKLMKVLYREDE